MVWADVVRARPAQKCAQNTVTSKAEICVWCWRMYDVCMNHDARTMLTSRVVRTTQETHQNSPITTNYITISERYHGAQHTGVFYECLCAGIFSKIIIYTPGRGERILV